MISTERTWSVGELARAAGVSVRALHHYDDVGLLRPSYRTGARHRRYGSGDVVRLYRIVALRSLGFELDEISHALDASPADLLEATRMRLADVDRQIAAASALQTRLTSILNAIERAQPPSTELLIDTMEAMSMSINLTRIYTKLGDAGETHLGDMSRVPKTDPRIEAYGEVDELNAQLGLAITAADLPARHGPWLLHVQNDLFDLGADLSVPDTAKDAGERLRLAPEQVTWVEARCDEVNATLAPLRSFVLPGGSLAGARLHVCRTVCRRAERRATLVTDANPEIVRYLNRLSDLLFILGRAANASVEEPVWQPGLTR